MVADTLLGVPGETRSYLVGTEARLGVDAGAVERLRGRFRSKRARATFLQDKAFVYEQALELLLGQGELEAAFEIVDADPELLDLHGGDLRLDYGSPCIDTGTNLSILMTTDLAGSPRPMDGNGDGLAAFGKSEPYQIGTKLFGGIDDAGCVWTG